MAASLGHGDAVQGCVELRLPGRESRCLARLDDHTGNGVVPLCKRRRLWCGSGRPGGLAEDLGSGQGPQPTKASRVDASVVIIVVI